MDSTALECLECVLPNCDMCATGAVHCGGAAICVKCKTGFTFDENLNCLAVTLDETNVAGVSSLQRRRSEHASESGTETEAVESLNTPELRNESTSLAQEGIGRSMRDEGVYEVAVGSVSGVPIEAPEDEVEFEASFATYADSPAESIAISNQSVSIPYASLVNPIPSSFLAMPISEVTEFEDDEGARVQVLERPAESTSSREATGVLSSFYARRRSSSSNLEESYSRNASFQLQSPCPLSYFYWNASSPCKRCDDHAAPGACMNFVGCLYCMPGYFRQKLEDDSPFTCSPCTLPNCIRCEDDVPVHNNARCQFCRSGFILDRESGQCIPL
eukprot:g7202.t1